MGEPLNFRCIFNNIRGDSSCGSCRPSILWECSSHVRDKSMMRVTSFYFYDTSLSINLKTKPRINLARTVQIFSQIHRKKRNGNSADWKWPHNARIDRRRFYRFKCNAALPPCASVIIIPIITTLKLQKMHINRNPIPQVNDKVVTSLIDNLLYTTLWPKYFCSQPSASLLPQ